MTAPRRRRRPEAERPVHVDPAPGLARPGADRVGGIERARVHVARLEADDRRARERRQLVGAEPPLGVGRDPHDALAPQPEQAQRLEDAHVDLVPDDHRERRRAEHPVPLDVPPLASQQRVARGGQAGEVGHGAPGHEASARGGRKPEHVPDPLDADLLQRRAHRGGDARARVLIPGAREPVRGQGGREGAPVHEAEVAASGVHDRGRRGDLVEQRHDGGRIGRAVGQRAAQLLEPRDGRRRGRHAAAREALEVAGGAVSGVAQEVVHGGGSFPVVGSRTGTHL